jgi:hypothetical protein
MSKRKIKVMWWRFLRRINRFFEKGTELTDSQKMGVKVFEKMVSIKDAEIFLSPLSDCIYIQVDDIYATLEGNDLRIVNGKFQYDLHYHDGVRSQLVRKVFNVLESRRVEVEKRIRTKSDRTLSSILDEITSIKKERNQ